MRYALILLAAICISSTGCGTKSKIMGPVELSDATYASPTKTAANDLERLPMPPSPTYPCGAIGPLPQGTTYVSDCGKHEDTTDNDCHYCAPKFTVVPDGPEFADPTDTTEDPRMTIWQGDPTADD